MRIRSNSGILMRKVNFEWYFRKLRGTAECLLKSLFGILANLIPCSLICYHTFKHIQAALGPAFFVCNCFWFHFWSNFFSLLIMYTIVDNKNKNSRGYVSFSENTSNTSHSGGWPKNKTNMNAFYSLNLPFIYSWLLINNNEHIK